MLWNRQWVKVSAAVALLGIVYAALVYFTGISPDAVSGLIGVLVGAATVAISQYWSAESNRKNALRLAALDRRLQAHQEAFALWRKLVANTHKEQGIGEVVIECQSWWEKNCLYLDPESREAFYRSYNAAFHHHELVESRENSEAVKSNWREIMRAGETIVRGVALPTIGELEAKVINGKAQARDA
jgi:hypothetical protein